MQPRTCFLATCSGRYWYRTRVDIRPRVTMADAETYARDVVGSFLKIYVFERAAERKPARRTTASASPQT
jgi:hypothetical protein